MFCCVTLFLHLGATSKRTGKHVWCEGYVVGYFVIVGLTMEESSLGSKTGQKQARSTGKVNRPGQKQARSKISLGVYLSLSVFISLGVYLSLSGCIGLPRNSYTETPQRGSVCY